MPDSRKEEMELVKKVQSDLQYFESLYEKYLDKVYNYFLYRLRNKEESEDLTSLTFEKAIINLHTFQDQGYSFSAWLFRIAHNNYIDCIRKKTKHKTCSLDDIEAYNEPSTPKIPDFIEDFDTKESLEKIQIIIKTLPPLHQEIWTLKLKCDLSHKEIADTLQLTENNVNVILFRSIKKIRNDFYK